ncbi:MAG: hypothetical protein H0W88_05440 [Parachlamydiaceae bacterium]|nr:hypothetical protein [Parachlamydiaceae bacterium]
MADYSLRLDDDPDVRALKVDTMEAAQKTADARLQGQVASKGALLEESESANAFNLINTAKRIATRIPVKRSGEVQKTSKSVFTRKEAEDLFEDFQNQGDNKKYHLNIRMMTDLAESLGTTINADLSEDEIITIIEDEALTIMGKEAEPAEIDKTFEFLISITHKKHDAATSPTAKAELNRLLSKLISTRTRYDSLYSEPIKEGHQVIGLSNLMVNLANQPENVETQLESPEQASKPKAKIDTTDALKKIRDMINNPKELSVRYQDFKRSGYSVEHFEKELADMLNYSGIELKTAEIEAPKLNALIKGIKSSQAMLNIFKLFDKKANLAERLIDMQELNNG